MRVLALSLSAMALSACSQAVAYDDAVTDHRFDLAASNMPPILTSDVKRCVSASKSANGEVPSDDEGVMKMFELVLDFWQVVDQTMLSSENAPQVLPFGGDAEAVKSIMPEGLKLPAAVGEACGEYGGAVIVKAGLLSLKESIDIPMREDPAIFDDMGVSVDDIMTGLGIISAQAAGLNELSVSETVDCVAIYQAAKVSNEALEPYSNIWLTAFVEAVEADKIDPENIRQNSTYWRVLANEGAGAVVEKDGYQARATQCDAWLNVAIEQQAATQ